MGNDDDAEELTSRLSEIGDAAYFLTWWLGKTGDNADRLFERGDIRVVKRPVGWNTVRNEIFYRQKLVYADEVRYDGPPDVVRYEPGAWERSVMELYKARTRRADQTVLENFCQERRSANAC